MHRQICSALMSVWEHLAVYECVEPSHMIYSITVRTSHLLEEGLGCSWTHAGAVLLIQTLLFCVNLQLHHISPPPPFSSSQWASLWQTPTEGVTWTAPPQSVFRSQCAPCFPPLAATEQLCWPSGCGGKGRRRCQMPRCFRVLLIKPFLWASESQSGESDGAEGKVNLWPRLSPVQQRTLNPVIAHPRLHPETPHDTASALQWSLQRGETGRFSDDVGMSLLATADNAIMVVGGIAQKPHGTT